MRPLVRLAPAAGLVALALGSGCSNALLFYETGKVALSLEARPNDASQPVQGSLAFKQRTAAIVPPLTKSGDAGAMISSFRFGKEPGFTGPITIQTALVTGAAAKAVVDARAAEEVAQAITGVPIASARANAVTAIENARADGKGAVLTSLAAKPWEQLTLEEKDTLGRITGAGSTYDKRLHDAIRAELGF